MEHRLLENRLLLENGHSRNRKFAGVATGSILLVAAVACVVTYNGGPSAGLYDGDEMYAAGECGSWCKEHALAAGKCNRDGCAKCEECAPTPANHWQRTATCDTCEGDASCLWNEYNACYKDWTKTMCDDAGQAYEWCPEGATSPPTEAPTRAPTNPTAVPTTPAPTPPTPKPPPTTALLTEGYYPGYKFDAAATAEACESNWRLAAGAFMPSIAADPPQMVDSCDNWLVLGGALVGSGNNPPYSKKYTASTVVSQMQRFNYQHVDFDMEGVLHDANNDVLALANEIHKTQSNAKFQFTIMGSYSQTTNRPQFDFMKQHHGTFDTIALMLYGQYMNQDGPGDWEINDKVNYQTQRTWKWLMEWVSETDIPNEKIMIGLTWLWDNKHPELLTPGWVINAYKQLVRDAGLKGLFFWDASNTPREFVGECLDKMEVECPDEHPAPEGCMNPTCPVASGHTHWSCKPGPGDNLCGWAVHDEPCVCSAGSDTNK